MKTAMQEAIRQYIAIPSHIKACANSVRFDLLYGPTFSLIPHGNIEEFKEIKWRNGKWVE